jgi:hypothetical protein
MFRQISGIAFSKEFWMNSQTLICDDILVAAGDIPSRTTFLREEEDSKKSKEDH